MTIKHQRKRLLLPASIGRYGSLIIASLFSLVPIIGLYMESLRTPKEIATGNAFAFPQNWFNFANYVTAFKQGDMAAAFINTTIILVISLFLVILLTSLSAYAIDRFAFRGKRLVLLLMLAASIIPQVTTQVATFQIVNALGLFNSRGAAIVLFVGTDIVSLYIFLQFMASIPKELDEAAIIDGASRWGLFWRVIFPLMKPAIATVAVVKGVAIYNEFYIPFLYMPSRDLGVISTSLFRFKGAYTSSWEVISAGAILVIVPTLIIFLFLQRFIYNGFASGATKG